MPTLHQSIKKQEKMNCQQVNLISIVDYLKSLGFLPSKVVFDNHWYLSPFRNESAPSFKVNASKNIYYDYGKGEGGRLIDFICRYNNCDVKSALEIVNKNTFSFHQQKNSFSIKTENSRVFKIIKTQTLRNKALIKYLHDRGILSVNNSSLEEIYYQYKNRDYFGIAFKNNREGYEIRSPYFKGCTSKGITTRQNNTTLPIYVFEGFFDYLSFLELIERNGSVEKKMIKDSNFMILNSTSLIKDAIRELKAYSEIKLFLDNDSTGISTCQEIKNNFRNAVDYSFLFKEYKDLNEFLMSASELDCREFLLSFSLKFHKTRGLIRFP